MPQQKYNSTKVSNVFALAQKRNAKVELKLLDGSTRTVKSSATIDYRKNSIDGIKLSDIVNHQIISTKTDSLRMDAADQLIQTGQFVAYNLDSGLNNLRHYEIEPSTGFLKFLAPVSRVGDLVYIDEKTGKPYTETVTAETLIDSIPTLKGKPITDRHPLTKLDRKNATQFTKGSTHNMAFFSNDWLWASGSIFDGNLIDEVLNGNKKQISMGYDALIKLEGSKLIQAKRDYNHLACCQRGRAGENIGFKVDQASDSPIMTLRLDVSDREIQRLTPPNEMLDFLRVNGKRVY